MKKLLLLFFFGLSAIYAEVGFVLYKTPYTQKELHDNILKAVEKAGFVASDDRDLANAYKIQFGQSDFSTYYNITVFDPKALGAISAKEPKIAAFAPFTILLYQKTGSSDSYWAFITPKSMANAVAIDKSSVKVLEGSNAKLLKEIKAILPKSTSAKVDYNSDFTKSKDLLFSVELPIGEKEVATKKKEEVYQQLESDLEVDGFKISNFTDFVAEFDKQGIKHSFEIYESYSICKLKVIYNASKQRPEAGVFAPCSVFFIKKKGDNKLIVGFPPTQNWMEVTKVTIPETTTIMKAAEEVVKKSLESNK